MRKAGGFPFAGTDPEFTGYTVKVDLVDAGPPNPGRNHAPGGMYVQSQPGYVALADFDGGAVHEARRPVTREHVQPVLRRVCGTDVTVAALHVAATWAPSR